MIKPAEVFFHHGRDISWFFLSAAFLAVLQHALNYRVCTFAMVVDLFQVLFDVWSNGFYFSVLPYRSLSFISMISSLHSSEKLFTKFKGSEFRGRCRQWVLQWRHFFSDWMSCDWVDLSSVNDFSRASVRAVTFVQAWCLWSQYFLLFFSTARFLFEKVFNSASFFCSRLLVSANSRARYTETAAGMPKWKPV